MLLQQLQSFYRKPQGVDLALVAQDLALRVDDDAGAPGGLLLEIFGGAIGHGNGVIRVAEQRETELVLFRKCPVQFGGIKADPEDNRILLVKLFLVIAEPATLGRSPRGVSHRIEPQDNVLTAQLGQLNGVAVVITQTERRGQIADLQLCHAAMLA